ncbi:MAG: molybdopterin-dependent oxidoreductase [Candidatus Bathyarchaeota archaeon]|nr:molybdopterin-dependent oxidoreductase [Candidatus Bathyarchaeota archaeon]
MTSKKSTSTANKKIAIIAAVIVLVVSLAIVQAQLNLLQNSNNPNTNVPSPTPGAISSASPTATATPTASPKPTPKTDPTQSPTQTSAPAPTATPTPTPSASPIPDWNVSITGNVNSPQTLSLSQIEALPATTINATLRSSGHPEDNGDYQFTGVTLWSLLQQAEIKAGASMVTVRASDGFSALFLVSEVEGNSQVLLAYLKDGQPIQVEAQGGDGPVRLVAGSDVYANRWVKFAVGIEVT